MLKFLELDHKQIVINAKEKRGRLNIFLQFLLTCVITVVVSIIAQNVIYFLFKFFNSDNLLKSSPFGTFLNMFFGYFFVITGIFLGFRFVFKRKISSMGLGTKGITKRILFGFFLGFVTFSFVTCLMLLSNSAYFVSSNLDFNNLLTTFSFILFFVLQGGTEEIICRGLFFITLLNASKSVKYAFFMQSIIFAAMHIGNNGVLEDILPLFNLFLYGIFAMLYVLKTDSLWGIIGYHAIWNFTQGMVYSFSVSGISLPFSIFKFDTNKNANYLLSGGNFGPEGSIFTTILLVILIYILVLLIKKENKIRNQKEAS